MTNKQKLVLLSALCTSPRFQNKQDGDPQLPQQIPVSSAPEKSKRAALEKDSD